MLQRSSFPSPATTELAESLQRSLDRSWLRTLQDTLRFPETWQQYLILLAFVLLIMAGMLFQVYLSVQIAQVDGQLGVLEAEHARTKRENSELIYQITMNTSLREVQRQAELTGYVPATARKFVVRVPADHLVAAPSAAAINDPPGARPLAQALQSTPEELAGGFWSGLSRSWQEGVADLQQQATTVTSNLVGDVMGWIR